MTNPLSLPQVSADTGPKPSVRSASVALEGRGWVCASADPDRDEPADARPPVRSLYIHVPFCTHKCHYCDFYSFVDSRDQQGAFVERLAEELRALAPQAHRAGGTGERVPLSTIFVGGGTPSLLRVDLWERLLGVLHACFDLSLMGAGNVANGEQEAGEFTVECNPETTTPELLAVLATGGVNRVSIGAQSFQPRHLRTLERLHDPANVERAVRLAREAGIRRQSVDLIFAIPDQTLDEWSQDLECALALGTTHLSCYNLTYEPNTAMTKRLRQGEFEPLDDETEARMYEMTVERLRAAGLVRYEVSNFARPGDESRHNLAYWRQEQWLAAGPSASGHVLAGASFGAGSWRWKNVARLGDYLASGTGLAPVVDLEEPDPARLVRERLMMGLRLREGMDAGALLGDLRALSPAAAGRLERGAARCVERGQMAVSGEGAGGGSRWRLTDAGMLLCDGIAGELMRAAAVV